MPIMACSIVCLLIQSTGGTGTAFTIDVDGRQYIITAKHIVDGIPNEAESTIQIRRKSGLVPLKVRVFKCDDPTDIAVLVPPAQLTVAFPLEPNAEGIAVGQDAYFVGFPYGEGVAYGTLPDVFGHVKRVTLSALVKLPGHKADQLLELDGYNNPGFSGSPVVWVPVSKKNSGVLEYNVAAVISDFIYDATPVVKKKKELQPDQVTKEDLLQGKVVRTITDGRYYQVESTDELVKLNTGIAQAWDIYPAIELIKQHPIGPKIDPNFVGHD